jgi:hypothetical protein
MADLLLLLSWACLFCFFFHLQEPGSSEAGLSSSNPHAAAPAGPPSDATGFAAAAAAAAAFGASSSSTAPGHGSAGTQLTSSEYDDLVADVVSNDSSTQLKLADLEAKLEIISPEDLTVRWQDLILFMVYGKVYGDLAAH